MAAAMARSRPPTSDALDRFSAVLGGAVFVLDAEGRIARWPARAADMTGFSREETVGRHCGLLYTPEDVATGEPEMDLALASCRGVHASRGLRLRRGGSRYRASMVIVPLIDGMDHLSGFCCVLRDVSGFTRSQHEADAQAPRFLEAVALVVGYAALLDAHSDPQLMRVAQHALRPLPGDGYPNLG